MGGAAGGDLLLLGAGHAHLEVIRQASRLQAAGARITVVSPPTFWYSGLATSVLAGRHTPQSNIIDVADLCRRKGVAFVEGEVVSGDVATRRVHLADGRSLVYDLLSVNLGSVVPDPIPGLAENGVPARPIQGLLALGAELAGMRGAERARSLGAEPEVTPDAAPWETPVAAPGAHASPPPSPTHRRRIVVLGGGPTGCEVALALRTRGGEAPEITPRGWEPGPGGSWPGSWRIGGSGGCRRRPSRCRGERCFWGAEARFPSTTW